MRDRVRVRVRARVWFNKGVISPVRDCSDSVLSFNCRSVASVSRTAKIACRWVNSWIKEERERRRGKEERERDYM